MTSFLRSMPFELPFQLQFHRSYIEKLNNWFVTTSDQQLAVCSEATTVRILPKMTERFQRLNRAMIEQFNLQSMIHFTEAEYNFVI